MLIRGRFGKGREDKQMKKERRKFGTIYYVRRKQGVKERNCGCTVGLECAM
jgi:hypothetical protein